ncbi:hypothetical protein [Bernardetia sp.]|uniref:hypothetical protein n=1 Tax=Bernardetia sp. TaxID=1937974 RepID=UPI0025C574BA|nr:hypothetical protein [Bernardetia sp.]
MPEKERKIRSYERMANLFSLQFSFAQVVDEMIKDLFLVVEIGTGKILIVNKAWEDRLGLDYVMMTGDCFIDYVAERSKEETWALFTGEKKGEVSDFEFSNYYKNAAGEDVLLEWHSAADTERNIVIATARIIKK